MLRNLLASYFLAKKSLGLGYFRKGIYTETGLCTKRIRISDDLDYSFTVKHPEATFQVREGSLGGIPKTRHGLQIYPKNELLTSSTGC